MKIDIVMLAMSQPEMTINAINRIIETTKDFDIRLLLINNGGGKEIRELEGFCRHVSAEYLEFEQNHGVAGGRNVGINWFLENKSDYLVNIDNDVFPARNWLGSLIIQDKDIGITAPMTNHTCNEFQRLNIPFDDFSNWYEYYLEGVSEPYIELPEQKYIIGFCTCVSREKVRKIGYYDDAYKLYGNEDADYYFTAKKLGYKNLLCRKSVVYHFGGKGLEGLGTRGGIEWSSSRRYFKKKWGFET